MDFPNSIRFENEDPTHIGMFGIRVRNTFVKDPTRGREVSRDTGAVGDTYR